jgi:cysteine-rich repeat protein
VNLFPNTPSKCENLCGNGRFNPIVGEECDTGAATGVGCQSDCTVTAGWTCEIGAAYGPTPCHKCGNSIVEVTETCDIGGEDVGCVGCVLQAGYTCTDTACTSTAP